MKKGKQGFTLIELILVIGIIAFILIEMVQLYIYSTQQAVMAGNKTIAINLAQGKIEEIRDHNYDSIATDYSSGGSPGATFTFSELDGIGTVSVDNSNTELLVFKVSVSWRDKYNRIVGEDTNLNGQLDAGEDANGNGELDSPVTLMSMITRR